MNLYVCLFLFLLIFSVSTEFFIMEREKLPFVQEHWLGAFRNQQAVFARSIIENSVDTVKINKNKNRQTYKLTVHEIDWLTNRFS